MADHKITDFVDQSAIDGLKRLKDELIEAKDTYIQTATELAKGLKVSVDGLDQLEKLTKQTAELQRQAAEATQRHSAALDEQGRIVANTTNTISRQLLEQERVNKAHREEYTETDRVKKLLEQYNDSYDDHIKRLMSLDAQLKSNKKEQKDLEQSYKMGRTSLAQYQESMATLIANQRSLTQEKRTLTQIMTAEEKAMQTAEGSYVQLSQQLELMKKAYKDMSAEGRESDLGKELENAIQNLDARLKDMAADMGEFQRNVGNYAIAGRDGIVTTESLMAAINQQAITTKDLADQNKILEEARTMLDSSDANYATTLEALNSKLAENRQKLTDVSDIMNVQATSVAEAEAQNKRLTEALKNVDLTSENAAATTAALNKKIEENNKIIEQNSASKNTLKKDLKELVLEIATLSIEYQNLSAEEQSSSEGQELKQHIDELIERAGALKDAISDTNQAISNAASDTRGFDQLGEGLQLAVDGFGLATGAAEMLGISEGDLAEVQTKLQAAIAASNALTKIQNTLQKQSSLMQGVALVQTKLRTTAENIHTAAQGKGVVVTKLATVAQWAFNAAASANPIGLLCVAIVACIAAVAGLIKVFSLFSGDSEKRKQRYEQEKKALTDIQESNKKSLEQAKARGVQEEELSNLTIEARKKEMIQAEKAFAAARAAYDEDEEEYKSALEAKEQATLDFYDVIEDAHNKVLQKLAEVEDAGRRATMSKNEYEVWKIDQQYKNLIRTTEIYYQQQIDDLAKLNLSLDEHARRVKELTDQMNAEKSALGTWYDIKTAPYTQLVEHAPEGNSPGYVTTEIKPDGPDPKQIEKARKEADALKKEVQKGEDALLLLITDSLERERKQEILAYDRKLADLKTKLQLIKDTKSQKYIAIQNQITGLEQQHQDKLQQIEFKGIERRLQTESSLIESKLAIVQKGSQEELNLTIQSINNKYEKELNTINKQETTHTLTAEEAEELRTNLLLKYNRLREKATEDHASKLIELRQAQYAADETIRNAEFSRAANALKARYAEELKEAGDNADKREEIERRYNDDMAALTEQYGEKSARAAIQLLEDTLKVDNLSAEDREKYERELAKAKVDLENQMADASIAAIKRTTEADTAAKEKRLANAQQWVQKAQEALSAISGLMGAVFEGHTQKLEDEQEANEEAADAEIERIDRLVEQNVITEEEGEARKRAAEERSAKKTEELERKKAKIKEKQAIYDKALSVMNVGLNTAMALMQLWVKPGWPAAIPMMAVVGALGALQLATVLATPIPKYAKGTKDHPGGLAIVGDGGRQEVVSYGGNMFLTPDTPTLIDMPKGAEVFPDADKLLASNLDLAGAMRSIGDAPQVVVNNDYSDLKREVVMLGNLIQSQTKAQIKTQRRIASNANYQLLKTSYGL